MRDVTDLVVRRQSGARLVYDKLRAWIIDGTLPAGDRLDEQQLSEYLGVTRPALTDALRLLQAESLVVETSTGGSRVAPLDHADARQVFEVHARLAGILARDACERAVPNDVVHLYRLVEQMAKAASADDLVRLSAQFHNHVEEIANNRWCSALLRQMRGHIDRYRTFAVRDRGSRRSCIEDHLTIAEAISGREPRAAELAMNTHLQRSAAHAERALLDLARQPSGAVPQAVIGRHMA